MPKVTKLFGLLVLACSGAATGAPTDTTTLYKSVGPDGRTVYSDRAPAAGPPAQAMTFELLPSSPLAPATLAYIAQLKKAADAPRPAVLASREVVLYTAAWCGYCKKARAHLAARGIGYREVDIETPTGVASYVQAGGQRGVPLLLADGRRLAGYSAAGYDAFFPAGK